MIGLVCKNRECSRPMPLPPATHPCTSQGRASWPKDGLSRSFLCPGCRHIYEYSPRDVVDLPLDERMPLSRKRLHRVVCIELRCGAESCRSQVQIHTLAEFDIKSREALRAILGRATPHSIRCDSDKTDTMTGPPRFEAVLHLWFDEGWEASEI
jgi:hypothetical protein